MNWRSKNLTTMAIIFLVLPFVTLMTLQMQNATADSPTVVITDVSTTVDYKIDVGVELTLTDSNYDYYIEFVEIYINQSIDNILAFEEANNSKTLSRQDEDTFETNILSPILTGGGHDDSAYYNVTIVAITHDYDGEDVTYERSAPVEWGEYIFIDTEIPIITFISPSVALEEVWGIYTIEVEILDESNLSLVEFYIDTTLKFEYVLPEGGKEIFTFDWITSGVNRGQHTIRVKAYDNTTAANLEEQAFTVEVVGPELAYRHGLPTSLDFNDTLDLNVTATDQDYNITSITLHYALDGVWINDTTVMNQEDYLLNITIAEQPLGTNITWEWFVNNSNGQYHVFRDNDEFWSILTIHWDHYKPIGEVTFDSQLIMSEQISVDVNITEQTLISSCVINYRVDTDQWQDESMTYLSEGAPVIGVNETWYFYGYNFSESYPIFTQIKFFIQLNDTSGNVLRLDNAGKYYTIKVIPHDLMAPNITLTVFPEALVPNQNITITVKVDEISALTSVKLYYTVNGIQSSVAMVQSNATHWSGSFILVATVGANVQIWVEAIDEYYNTGASVVEQYEVETSKVGVNHSNFFLWLMLIVLLIAPIVVTLLILRPQK